jgi:hypothetical protein
MSTKSTALLVALAALLFAFIYFVERPAQVAANIPADQSVLPGINPEKVTSIEFQIDGGARMIRLEKSNDLWQVTAPVPYPASARHVANFLQQLAQWQWDSVIENPSSWEEFGLVQDQFTISVNQGDGVHTLKVGNLSPVGDKVYLSLLGSHQIFVAGTNVLGLISKDDFAWRDLTLMNLNLTPFQRLKVTYTNGDFMKLQLDPVTLLWKMTAPSGGARADSAKINDLLTRLQCTPIRAFATGGTLPDHPLILTFLRDANETSDTNIAVELQVGPPLTNAPEFSVATRLSPPGLIVISNAAILPWEGDYTNFLDRHLISVSPATIASVAIEGRGIENFTVQKSESNLWQVTCTNGESFPADPVLMQDWLSALTNIQVAIGRSPQADLTPFGLDNPATALVHYKLIYAANPAQTNTPATDLLFGLGTNRPPPIFEMGNGEKTVNSIDIDSFNRLPRFYWQLRNRSIWRFRSNEVVAIAIHQHGCDLRYTRNTNGIWTKPVGYAVNEPFQAAFEETLAAVGQLDANYWSGYDDSNPARFGFDEADYRISFELNRHGQTETNTVQFGGASAYVHPYASITRNDRRLIFEFPADIYAEVAQCFSIPKILWRTR